MPRVEKYGPPKVDARPIVGNFREGSKSPNAYGAAIGDRLAGVAVEQIDRLATQAREQADQAFALDASNQFDHEKNVLLYDPEKGATNKRGKDAFGVVDDYLPQFDTFASTVEAQAKTPRQKATVAALKSRNRQDLEGSLYQHMDQQFHAYTASELDATIENAKSSAAQNFADPVKVASARDGLVQSIAVVGKTLGMGDAEIRSRTLKETTQLHAAVIEQYLAADQDSKAKAYYDAAKGEISGDAQPKIETALEAGTLRVRAQQESDRIVREGGTYQEQRDKVKQITDAKLRDETMTYVEHEFNVSQQATEQTKRDGLIGLYNAIDQRPSLSDAKRSTVWQTLTGSEREGVMSYINARVQGVPVKTDLSRWLALNTLAADDPEAFAKIDFNAERGRLSVGDIQQFSDLQRSIKNGDRSAATKQLAGFSTNREVVEHSLTDFGIDPNAKPNTPAGKGIAELYRELDTRSQVFEQATGKKPGTADVQQMVDDLLRQFGTPSKPGWLWGSTPASLAVPTDKRLIVRTAGDVPALEREKIKAMLTANHQTVTDEAILYWWNKKQAAGAR